MTNTNDLLSLDDLSPDELEGLLDLAAKIKASPEDYRGRLDGKAVAMIFEKPSTRTRTSFEVAIGQLGAQPVNLPASELHLGRGETIEDTGRVLSRYVDAIVIRTFEQERIEVLAGAASVPVINALSDFEHPCQVFADLLTIREQRGTLADRKFAFLGDGNNLVHSLLLGCAKTGMRISVATPPGYEPIPQVVQRAEAIASGTGGSVEVTNDPDAAATAADVLYTDVWASMGQEQEAKERALVFPEYQLDEDAVSRANEDVLVMHCLPAHRGEEISAGVMDGPHSVVWDQAENRLHTQKALLLWVFGLVS